MAGEVQSQRDGSGVGSMTLCCRAVGRRVGRIVEGGQEFGEGMMFCPAPCEPDVVLGHGLAVSLLEFCCGADDQILRFAELTLQHVLVGAVGDEH